MGLDKIFVAGSGLMGSGIAQVCAQAGKTVVLYDLDAAALAKALKNISWSAAKLVEKGRVQGSVEEIMNRVTAATDLSEVASADLVIEAVFENLEVKRELFRLINDRLGPEAVAASNTSAIPITEIAAAVSRPENFLGLHFFSPVPMMAAVEVVKGMATSAETMEKGRRFVLEIGKEPIMVHRDVAGFVINRINFPSAIEAMRLVEAGVASVEDIDKGLRLASGRKMGIFETGDLVGLDVTHGAMLAMFHETGEERWYPPLLPRRKVKAGRLGRKTGSGWYEYDENGNKK
ncbi:MAG: 3-hydroxyacyl-CoA dehydrogenase family protein [Pseudomonadota bacterium]